jgi:lipopolysaccharide/colanic/teichoic acid biosynthesis glycosyltransferase
MTATTAEQSVSDAVHWLSPVSFAERRAHGLAKSVCDRFLALTALAVLLVPMAALGLAIRLTSGGPALFLQVRLGRHGRPFRILKFRTMVQAAEAAPPDANDSDGLLFKIREDPRVTGIGRFLRAWSLDELPQLINVLRGDMSMVGPRPLPVDLHQLTERERRRLLVKPGLTGLWQVSGRSDLGWEDCVRLDLEYVDSWTVGLDLRILGRTAGAVVRRHGVY